MCNFHMSTDLADCVAVHLPVFLLMYICTIRHRPMLNLNLNDKFLIMKEHLYKCTTTLRF